MARPRSTRAHDQVILVGPMMYTHMTRLMGATLPGNLAERVVDAFWTAHAQPAEAVETRPSPSGRVRAKRQGRVQRST